MLKHVENHLQTGWSSKSVPLSPFKLTMIQSCGTSTLPCTIISHHEGIRCSVLVAKIVLECVWTMIPSYIHRMFQEKLSRMAWARSRGLPSMGYPNSWMVSIWKILIEINDLGGTPIYENPHIIQFLEGVPDWIRLQVLQVWYWGSRLKTQHTLSQDTLSACWILKEPRRSILEWAMKGLWTCKVTSSLQGGAP